MKLLFIGDIMGKPGRRAVAAALPAVRAEHHPDFVVANAENAAGGFGLTPPIAEDFFKLGVGCITLGNHAWDKRDMMEYIGREPRIIRPANYPPSHPGSGVYCTQVQGVGVAVIQLIGRVFMGPADDPFRVVDELLDEVRAKATVIFVDMHGEASSEKAAMGHFLDGKVSAVIGSHTHVPTRDTRILPGGTAFQTDAGMTGPVDSVIGIDKNIILQKFLTGLPVRFEVADGPAVFSATLVETDAAGRAVAIQAVERLVD